MNRLVLGAAFVCLLASQSFGTGFAIPRLPDLSLWLPTPPPETDAAIRTGDMHEARQMPQTTATGPRSQHRTKETAKSP
jgi:hypothetical protein